MSKNGGFGFCSTCGAPLVQRIARKGAHAGKHFLACSDFPRCKQVRLVKNDAPLQKAR